MQWIALQVYCGFCRYKAVVDQHIEISRVVVRAFLLGLGAGVALAWLLESVLMGRGVISTYLAPVAFIAPIVAAFFREK